MSRPSGESPATGGDAFQLLQAHPLDDRSHALAPTENSAANAAIPAMKDSLTYSTHQIATCLAYHGGNPFPLGPVADGHRFLRGPGDGREMIARFRVALQGYIANGPPYPSVRPFSGHVAPESKPPARQPNQSVWKRGKRVYLQYNRARWYDAEVGRSSSDSKTLVERVVEFTCSRRRCRVHDGTERLRPNVIVLSKSQESTPWGLRHDSIPESLLALAACLAAILDHGKSHRSDSSYGTQAISVCRFSVHDCGMGRRY